MFASQRRPAQRAKEGSGAVQAARRRNARQAPAQATADESTSGATASSTAQLATTEQSGVFPTAQTASASPPGGGGQSTQLRSKPGPTVAKSARQARMDPKAQTRRGKPAQRRVSAGYGDESTQAKPAQARGTDEVSQAKVSEGYGDEGTAQAKPAQARGSDEMAQPMLAKPADKSQRRAARSSTAECEPCSNAADLQSLGLPAMQTPGSKQQTKLERPTDTSQPETRDPAGEPAERQADQIGDRIGRDLSGVGAVRPGKVGAPVQRVAERHLGVNMAGAELRTDTAAANHAASMDALAVTEGSTVSFADGKLSTKDSDSRSLIGHELTHVAQQRAHGMAEVPQRQAAPESAGAPGVGGTGGGASAKAGGAGAQGTPAGAAAGGGAKDGAAAGGAATGGKTGPVAGGGGEGGGAEAASATSGEILMPEPPMEMSGAERARIEGVDDRAGAAGGAVTDLPSAAEQAADARGAVTEPQEETKGRAEAALVAALGGTVLPDPKIILLCAKIQADIRLNRPPSEQDVYRANPKATADRVGKAVSGDVKDRSDQASAQQKQIETPPEGQASLQPEPPQVPPKQVETGDLSAERAAPNAVPAENISLDQDVAAQDQKLAAAGMETEPAKVAATAGEGPLAEAQAARGELGEMAKKDPKEVMAEQSAAIADARSSMEALQARALSAMQTSRADTVSGGESQQQGMVQSEEQQRKSLSGQARDIFTQAQSDVTALLDPLPANMEARWSSGIAPLSTAFENDLANVKNLLAKRYEGVSGWFNELGDAVLGLPSEITALYTRAETNFANGVCNLALEISTEVNTILKAADTIIDTANTRIAALFTNLDPSLAAWAEQEKAKFEAQLTGLKTKVNETRTQLRDSLLEKSSQTIHEARSKIHELREAAKGLLGRIADAVTAFAENPGKFILEGLLKLVGIPPAAFWGVIAKIGDVIDQIAEDPMKFANAAAMALKQGFQMFFDNIGTHLMQGFLDWLFSAMGKVGVTMPADFSLKSMITFFLQLMGLSWANIRAILAKHIGEENVALIEKAWELISEFIAMGPEGLFELIKEKLDPQAILDMVIEAAVDFIVQTVVTQAAARIVALFNPVGAIAQAVEAIYRVLKWVFTNAARIFKLVETVVNGVADLLAGNVGGLASAIENALAGLIPPVIDFIADYVGLGDLPEKIAGVVGGLQSVVLGAVDKVIGFIAEKAKGLLAALGIGEQPEGTEQEEPDEEDPETAAKVAAAEAFLDNQEQPVEDSSGAITVTEAEQVAQSARANTALFKSIRIVGEGENRAYEYTVNPKKRKPINIETETDPKNVIKEMQDVLRSIRSVGDKLNQALSAEDKRDEGKKKLTARRAEYDAVHAEVVSAKSGALKADFDRVVADGGPLDDAKAVLRRLRDLKTSADNAVQNIRDDVAGQAATDDESATLRRQITGALARAHEVNEMPGVQRFFALRLESNVQDDLMQGIEDVRGRIDADAQERRDVNQLREDQQAANRLSTAAEVALKHSQGARYIKEIDTAVEQTGPGRGSEGDGSSEQATDIEIATGKQIKGAWHGHKSLQLIVSLRSAINNLRQFTQTPEIVSAIERGEERLSKLEVAAARWNDRHKINPDVWGTQPLGPGDGPPGGVP